MIFLRSQNGAIPAAVCLRTGIFSQPVRSSGYPGAALELLDINHANGAVLPGLTRRREAERELFLGTAG